MKFDDYQQKARRTAIYSPLFSLVYPTLGLAGEAGELANKVKKIIRDDQILTQSCRQELIDECGDVLWYLSNICSDLGIPLEDVAIRNLNKLSLRQEKGTLQGSGDNR